MKSPRQIVAESLWRIEKSASWSNMTLDSAITKNKLDARDAAFVSAALYGSLERLITLDACIAAYGKRPEKLDVAVRAILRASIYQILYMDSVPEYAAVSEAVDLAKKMGAARASGFVNAVLRAFLKADKKIPVPSSPPEKRLSVEYSVDESLARLWLESLGAEKTEAMLKGSFGRPPIYIRANTLKTTPEALAAIFAGKGAIAEIDDMLPCCLAVSGYGAVSEMKAYKDGLFHVQDKSSQMCVEALDIQPNQRVLDACAAPGGKSFTITQKLENTGTLVSAELHEKRVPLMEKGAKRLGIKIMDCIRADMTETVLELGQFDRVLCDVPCSGYGVIRRKPEIRYKPPSDFSEIAGIQYKLLRTASQYLCAGGKLVYSSCTVNPAENGDISSRFLAENPDFAPSPLPGIFDADGSHEKTLTGDFGGDFFYVASFERVAGNG